MQFGNSEEEREKERERKEGEFRRRRGTLLEQGGGEIGEQAESLLETKKFPSSFTLEFCAWSK